MQQHSFIFYCWIHLYFIDLLYFTCISSFWSYTPKNFTVCCIVYVYVCDNKTWSHLWVWFKHSQSLMSTLSTGRLISVIIQLLFYFTLNYFLRVLWDSSSDKSKKHAQCWADTLNLYSITFLILITSLSILSVFFIVTNSNNLIHFVNSNPSVASPIAIFFYFAVGVEDLQITKYKYNSSKWFSLCHMPLYCCRSDRLRFIQRSFYTHPVYFPTLIHPALLYHYVRIV